MNKEIEVRLDGGRAVALRARVKFHEDLCKGCGLCVHFCPRKIIFLDERINAMGYHPATVTEQERCTGCCICAWMCPDVVIEIERDEVA